MSKLEELIQQYCPDGVEWKTLAECCNILDGKRKPITKGARQSGPYPYYGANGIQDWVADYIFDGTYVLIGEDGSVITPNGTPIVNWAHGKIWVNNHAHIIAETTGVLLRFLFYYIQIIDIHNLVHGNIPKLTQGDLKEIEIPVPPLPVQEEIVGILDTFTELQAELQAELQKRKQQYNYYLDNLLNFKNINRGGCQAEVRWMKMSEVMSISRGASPRPIQNYLTDAEDGIPWIKIGDVSPSSKYISSTKEKIKKEGATKSRYLKKGDFILSNSMSFGRPYILNIDGCIHDGWISMYGFEEHLDQDYLYYVLRSESVQTFWTAKANSGGAVSNLNSDIVRKTLIPIPSMAEQKRIASILDRFDRLTNDLTSGLPAEIEKRRQQYEYYRDKLLTFKRKGA